MSTASIYKNVLNIKIFFISCKIFYLSAKGYQFTLPFLDNGCGLHIDENYISPLYKHCINAEHPTMAVIGMVFTSAVTQMIEIQVTTSIYSFEII